MNIELYFNHKKSPEFLQGFLINKRIIKTVETVLKNYTFLLSITIKTHYLNRLIFKVFKKNQDFNFLIIILIMKVFYETLHYFHKHLENLANEVHKKISEPLSLYDHWL